MLEKFKLKPENTVLLVIDMQEKLLRVMSEKEKMYKSHELLLGLCDTYKIPVVACRQYPRGLGDIVPEVKIPEGAHIIDKVQFSALVPEMEQVLQDLNRKTVIITGSETHVCVFQTARGLLQKGYNVHVPRDAVCSRFKEDYKNGLDLMKNMGAVITNTETIAFDIMQQAGTPEFKKVSGLLR